MNLKIMENFDDILQHLLVAIEANPEVPVEDVLKTAGANFGVNPDGMKEIEEAFRILDVVDEKAKDLGKARKDGMTRNGWVEKQLTNIAEKVGEDGSEVISVIQKGTEDGLTKTLN